MFEIYKDYVYISGRELSVDCVVEKMGPATKAHAVMTYKVNGITVCRYFSV